MLRVGLTGELGSGKSTVARLLAERGAVVLSSDEMGRAMMQPGQAVYDAIVRSFGPQVVLADGQLNRPELARLAFAPEHARVEDLNAIVHPAVLAEQERRVAQIAQTQPDAVVAIESALIFSTKHAGSGEPWRSRFDCIVLVSAPEALKLERFVQRASRGAELSGSDQERLREDARRRLAAQKISVSAEDVYLVHNDGGMDELRQQVDALWSKLHAAVRNT